MPLIKRPRDKKSPADDIDKMTDSVYTTNQQQQTANDGGFSSQTIKPRKSIRAYSGSPDRLKPRNDNGYYEDTYLLYKGRKTALVRLMISLTKSITWINKTLIYYQHKHYQVIRLIYYLLIVLIAGLIRDYLLNSTYSPLSSSVIAWIETNLKTSKRSFVNVYFVKLGWLWTFIALIPFFVLTRFFYAKRITLDTTKVLNSPSKTIVSKKKKTVQFNLDSNQGGDVLSSPSDVDNLENVPIGVTLRWKRFVTLYLLELLPTVVRLALATVIWYYAVQFFVYFSKIQGHCQDGNNKTAVNTELECIKLGHKWILGFDISGHIFLMVYSNLIRIEELIYLFKRFEEFAQYGQYFSLSRDRSQNYVSPYRFVGNNTFHLVSTFLLLLSSVVTLVWDFMIIQTAFFYHTLWQKLAGLAFAIVGWALTYRFLYTVPLLKLQVVSKSFPPHH